MRYHDEGEPLLPWLLAHLDRGLDVIIAGRIDAGGAGLLLSSLRGLLSRGGRLTVLGGRGVPELQQLEEEHPARVSLRPPQPETGLRVAIAGPQDQTVAFVGSGSLTLTGLPSASGLVLDTRRDLVLAGRLFAALSRDPDAAEPTGWVGLSDSLSLAMEVLEGASDRGPSSRKHAMGLAEAIPSGHHDLDELTGGGRPGELWVVNGEPGVGRTTFALGLARSAAIRTSVPVTWLSTRDEPSWLTTLLLSAESRVLLRHLRSGGLSDEEWTRLARRMGEVADAPIVFGLAAPSGVFDALARVESDVAPQVLVLDALPAATDSHLLQALKDVARARSCWVVAIAPDDAEQDQDHVRAVQSASADLVLWLERDDLHDPDSPRIGEGDVRVVYSRNSPTTFLTLSFQGCYGRWVDLSVGAPT